jgi:hypothetical protein
MKQLMILAAMMLMTLTAKAISYGDAKSEALFLSDKMVYELDLTDEQYEAVYEINLDYLLCVNNPDDLFGICWERRNADLRDVLSDWQYERFLDIEYFYRPVRWEDEAWAFAVYDHYMRDVFFFNAPKAFGDYRGGHALVEHYYADRIANKPASAEHQHAPAPHPSATPGNINHPAIPNNPRPSTPNRPAGGMGPGGMGPGGGRPMGGRR